MLQELDKDVAKEVLTVLSNFDNSILDKLPKELFEELISLAADSEKKYYLKPDKTLEEQELSEDCKDILAIIYYNYSADDSTKEKLLNIWKENEKEN